jgi:TnpA family transposase
VLFYSTVFSSSERDAAYVIDGLLHNDSFKSDMHSTDTHGYTEIVFAASHLIKTSFAPRLKDIDSQSLMSFDKIKSNLNQKGYFIQPDRYANKKSIVNNWDTILRFMATIQLREHKASTILKRLNSYDKQHPLQDAMKEFGRIIKSIFILNYIDDTELRQTIEEQLNKGELANKFSSAVTVANGQEIMQVNKEDQEIAVVCKMIIQNVIILWNYIELTKLIMRSDKSKRDDILENMTNASILSWKHANLLGTYDFSNLQRTNDDEFETQEVVNFKML